MTTQDDRVKAAARRMFEAQQEWTDPISYHSEFTWEGLCENRPEEAVRFRVLAYYALTTGIERGDAEPPHVQVREVRVTDANYGIGFLAFDDDLDVVGYGDTKQDAINDLINEVRAAVQRAKEAT